MSKKTVFFILAASLAVLIVAHIGLHPNCANAEKCAAPNVARNIAMANTKENRALDSSALELVLARLRVDSRGQLVFSMNTESILNSASKLLSFPVSDEQWRFISRVISNGFPHYDTTHVVSLLKKYSAYYWAAQDMSLRAVESQQQNQGSNRGHSVSLGDAAESETVIASIDAELQQLNERERLQKKYLGETTAGKLFLKQNSLARYMLELRRIDIDPSLNAEQKKAQSQRIDNILSQLMRGED